jgi:hypothetical protein
LSADGVRISAIHVEAQQFPEQRIQVLGPFIGIAGGAAVTRADVQHTVWAEGHPPAVVIWERLIVDENTLFAFGIGVPCRIGGKAGDDGIPRPPGVVHIESAVCPEPGVKRQPEQPLLVGHVEDPVANVEEGFGLQP